MKKENNFSEYWKTACVLAQTYFGEEYQNIERLVMSYGEEITEAEELLGKDEEFNKLHETKKLDYIADLIIGLRIRNNVISMLEKVPNMDDEYTFYKYLPYVYDDVLDDLGVSIDRYNYNKQMTFITRYREMDQEEQEEVIESYVRKRNY